MARTFSRDRQAVELAGETDGEIADVDHFLHFTEAFGADLAGFDRHQTAEIVLGGAQLFAEQAHQFAAFRCRHEAPGAECGMGLLDFLCRFIGRNGLEAADLLAGNRGVGRHAAVDIQRLVDAELFENGGGFGCNGRGLGCDVHLMKLQLSLIPASGD